MWTKLNHYWDWSYSKWNYHYSQFSGWIGDREKQTPNQNQIIYVLCMENISNVKPYLCSSETRICGLHHLPENICQCILSIHIFLPFPKPAIDSRYCSEVTIRLGDISSGHCNVQERNTNNCMNFNSYAHRCSIGANWEHTDLLQQHHVSLQRHHIYPITPEY
jgi:hypothetical protein